MTKNIIKAWFTVFIGLVILLFGGLITFGIGKKFGKDELATVICTDRGAPEMVKIDGIRYCMTPSKVLISVTK